MKHKISPEEVHNIQEKTQLNLWWYCNSCLKGIQKLEQRFDCFECENYSLCKKCYFLNVHDHKMKKFVVPETSNPPTDEEIQRMLEQMNHCFECEEVIDKFHSYYLNKTDEEKRLCENCIYFIKEGEKLRDYKQIKPEKSSNAGVSPYDLVDFEDVIGNDIKTRFSYIPVKQEDFGLTDAELLFADD